MTEALAGVEAVTRSGEAAAPISAGQRGPVPTTIIGEARMIAANLEPLRHEWGTLTPMERGQRLIDAVHATLGKTGLPKPEVSVLALKGNAGEFHKEQWMIQIDSGLVAKKNPTVEEFAWACEVARHEMEHALQFFRVARREHSLMGEGATELAGRLGMPEARVQDAIDAHTGKREAEAMPSRGAIDQSAAAIYENVYTNRTRRNEVIKSLQPLAAELAAADAKLAKSQDEVLDAKALDEWLEVKARHDANYQEYRKFPEEIPAFVAGGEVAAAVREQAKAHDAALLARRAEERAASSSRAPSRPLGPR